MYVTIAPKSLLYEIGPKTNGAARRRTISTRRVLEGFPSIYEYSSTLPIGEHCFAIAG